MLFGNIYYIRVVRQDKRTSQFNNSSPVVMVELYLLVQRNIGTLNCFSGGLYFAATYYASPGVRLQSLSLSLFPDVIA